MNKIKIQEICHPRAGHGDLLTRLSGQARQGHNAFTLVELIVVITILAILGTIAFISLQGYSSQSRDSVRISDMSSMKTGLELFNLDAGKYPSPSDEIIITYSGAIVWTQGYFGEQTTKNIDKLDKIPTDPLTDKKYVYSTTNTRQEFQLAGAMEGDDVAASSLPWGETERGIFREQVQASEKTARLKISGNYNGKVLKVATGSTSYVLAVPSIITSSGITLESITTNNYLAYNGYKNLPFQYNGTYKTQGETNLNLVNSGSLVVYQGDLLTLSDSTQIGIDARKLLIQKLQNAYSGTTIKNIGEINTILQTNTTDTNATEAISTALVSYNLGGSILATNITYSTCSFSGTTLNHNENVTAYNEQTILWNAIYDCTNRQITRTCNNGTLSGSGAYQYSACIKGTATNCSANGSYAYNTHTYSIPALTHGTSTGAILSTTVSENNGTFKYILDNITCNDGVLTSQNENVTPTVQSCNSGYSQSGNTCVLNTYTVSGSFGVNANGATINVCGSNVTADASGNFTSTRNHGSTCNNITATRTGYTCNTTTNGPASLTSNTTNIAGSCTQNNSCNSTQPTNATLTTGSPTTPSQAWQNTNSSNPCYFTCSAGNGWNGTSCVTATDCGVANLTEITLTNGQTWSCKNLGATAVRDGSTNTFATCTSNLDCSNKPSWYGNYYQWGRNEPVNTTTTVATYNGTFTGLLGHNNFVLGEGTYGDWWQNEAGNTTPTRWTGTNPQGPCQAGWHVPSQSDWQLACNNILSTTCSNGMVYNSLIATKLRLPFAGNRNWSNGNYSLQSTNAYYWSSTPSSNNAYSLNFITSHIYPANINSRGSGFSVRCIKN